MSLMGPLDSFEIEDMLNVYDFPYHPDDEDTKSSLYREYGPLPESQEGIEELIGQIMAEKRQNDTRKHILECRERQMAHQISFLRDELRQITNEDLDVITDPSNHEVELRKSEVNDGE